MKGIELDYGSGYFREQLVQPCQQQADFSLMDALLAKIDQKVFCCDFNSRITIMIAL